MIFLVSSERSGSNMLRAIMGRHSQISAPPPPHLVKTFVPLLPAYGRLHDEENLRRLIADVLAVIDNQLGKWSSSFAGEQIVRDLPDRSFPALLRYVYEHEARANGKSISFVKDNGNILWLADLQAAVESPRFVYLVRDPRDYALSWSKSVVHGRRRFRGSKGVATRAESSIVNLCHGTERRAGLVDEVRRSRRRPGEGTAPYM